MKLRLFALAATALLIPALASAQSSTWTIDPMHSQADFEIRHMGVSNVRGAFSNITGTVEWNEKDVSKSKVVADIDVTTVNTGVTPRDSHLKTPEFFDSAKFPTMHFESTSVSGSVGHLTVVGNLTIAGVTKPVTLAVDGPVAPQKGMKGGLVSGFEATTTIKRADFGFGSKYAPAMLGDEVKITLDLEIDQK